TDILQSFIDLSTKDGLVDLQEVTDYIIDVIFAAVHSTSQTITLTLYEYAARPEYWKELLEENEIISNSIKDGYLDSQDVNNMVKLDSFIKETLSNWVAIVGLQHKTLNDHFTFSNGYQVPKGRNVYINLAKVHNIDQMTSTFDGFRHVEKNSPATKLDNGYLAFGHGRHACPGRFLAIHEIKLIIYFLLRKYKIETKDRNIIKPVLAGSFIMP
ncbi:8586_t:CDS:2, partial [Scutellospora calospora]